VRQARPIRRLWSDESGATAIEYGLICAMIAVVVISIAGVGGGLTATYNKLSAIVTALGGGGGGNNGT
jgi:pilus assembly protein Flp/PilA